MLWHLELMLIILYLGILVFTVPLYWLQVYFYGGKYFRIVWVKLFLPKWWMFTQVMKISSGWTVYTRHKICIEMKMKYTFSILSDTSKLWLYHSKPKGDPHGRCTRSPHSPCSPCLHGCMHRWGLVIIMHVVHTMQKWNKGLRSEVT